jgi:hypothetical protein
MSSCQERPFDFRRLREIEWLAEQMRTAHEVDDLFLEGNLELVLAAADLLGWRVCLVEPWSIGLLRCRLERPTQKPRSASHPLLS